MYGVDCMAHSLQPKPTAFGGRFYVRFTAEEGAMKMRHLGTGLLCAAFALVAGRSAIGDEKDSDHPFSDTEFVRMAAVGGIFEVESSKLAKAQATNDLVKKFADRMVKDHTKANKELVAVAKGMQLQTPEKMDEKHQKMVDALGGVSGAEFDTAYINAQVKAHDKTVALFKRAARDAKNPELKEFATKTLPVLEEHQKMAHELQQQFKK